MMKTVSELLANKKELEQNIADLINDFLIDYPQIKGYKIDINNMHSISYAYILTDIKITVEL